MLSIFILCLLIISSSSILNSDISATVQEMASVRKTINLPITSSAPNTPPDVKQRRKTTYTPHKSKTIGIPAEINTHTPEKIQTNNNKSKLNFFGGFRNTLKSKNKNDSMDLHNRELTPDKNDLHNRHWNDTNTTVII